MKTLLLVKIGCINRSSKERFDRQYWSELSALPEPHQKKLESLGTGPLRARDFADLRPHLTDAAAVAAPNPENFESIRFLSVGDYFEDEARRALDEIGLIQVITGDEFPVLLHNVKSVLRLGPATIVRTEQWSVESANTIAHFLQLVETIGTSEWISSDCSISMPATDGSPRPVHSFECPNLASTYAILLPVRQLCASDHVFNHACNEYMRFTGDDRKRAWIAATKSSFNAYLQSAPRPFGVDCQSVGELLDLVMYGAGMVHYSKGATTTRDRFRDVIRRHPRELVIFSFVMCCRELYKHATDAYFVLRQDIEHWVSAHGCVAPDLMFQNLLFQSQPLQTTP